MRRFVMFATAGLLLSFAGCEAKAPTPPPPPPLEPTAVVAAAACTKQIIAVWSERNAGASSPEAMSLVRDQLARIEASRRKAAQGVIEAKAAEGAGLAGEVAAAAADLQGRTALAVVALRGARRLTAVEDVADMAGGAQAILELPSDQIANAAADSCVTAVRENHALLGGPIGSRKSPRRERERLWGSG